MFSVALVWAVVRCGFCYTSFYVVTVGYVVYVLKLCFIVCFLCGFYFIVIYGLCVFDFVDDSFVLLLNELFSASRFVDEFAGLNFDDLFYSLVGVMVFLCLINWLFSVWVFDLTVVCTKQTLLTLDLA